MSNRDQGVGPRRGAARRTWPPAHTRARRKANEAAAANEWLTHYGCGHEITRQERCAIALRRLGYCRHLAHAFLSRKLVDYWATIQDGSKPSREVALRLCGEVMACDKCCAGSRYHLNETGAIIDLLTPPPQ